MTTNEIANRLVEFCRKGNFKEAQSDLFSDNAISVEPYSTADFEKETKGLEAIKKKAEKWNSMVKEVHNIVVSDPLIATNSFACIMRFDVTMKELGHVDMTELCVYHVKVGKIISEDFFV